MHLQTCLSPALSSRQCLFVIVIIICQGSEFIKRHMNVSTDPALDFHGFPRADEVLPLNDRIPEADAVFCYMRKAFTVRCVCEVFLIFHSHDFSHPRSQGHDLESAGVRQCRPAPSGPLRQPPLCCNVFRSISKVVSIGQHSLGTDLMKILHGHKRNFSSRPNAHECRCVNVTMRCMNDACTSQSIQPLFDFKGKTVV